MSDSPQTRQPKRIEQAERAERLAGALRSNLHRRKAQARARAMQTNEGPPARGGKEPSG